jgi:integrase
MQIEYYTTHYLEDCECVGQSVVTVRGKRMQLPNATGFSNETRKASGPFPILRQLFYYLRLGHEEPDRRWGQRNLTKPMGQRTVRYYYTYLQGLFKWFVQQGIFSKSLMEGIQRPPNPTPPIHVSTDQQIIALLKAAARSQSPHRNIAFLLFLLDTGVRASEACTAPCVQRC